jgi:hypothetical protein
VLGAYRAMTDVAMNPSASSPAEYIGLSTIVVSHAWCYPFLLLVAFMRNHVSRLDSLQQTYFFVDLLSINQHDIAELNSQPQARRPHIGEIHGRSPSRLGTSLGTRCQHGLS